MSTKSYYEPQVASTKKAIFAQGCFWGPDGIYAVIPSVIRVKVGYTGGKQEDPTYKNIGDHTEAFVVEYDPETTTYSNLLATFWSSHDPTILNKTQYKSAIYFNDEKEQQLAEDTLKEEQKRYQTKIVTEILPASTFYNAEDFFLDADGKVFRGFSGNRSRVFQIVAKSMSSAKVFPTLLSYHQKYILRTHHALFNSLGMDGAHLMNSHVATRLNGYLSGHGSVEMFDKESPKWGLTHDQLETVRKVVKEGVKIVCQ